MKKTDAAKLARKLMNEHGLGYVKFEYSSRKGALGDCSYRYDGAGDLVPARIRLYRLG